MKGTVTRELNRRMQHPGVNAVSPGFYEEGEVLSIADAVAGDSFEGNNIWYRLNNGEYVWSGAVSDIEIESLDYKNQDDRKQYMLCFREIDVNHFPDIRSQEVPQTLRFATLQLPQSPETIQVFDVSPEDIANTVIDDIRKLEDPARKHVLIYIHGYDFLKGLKVDLLSQFVLNYTSHPQNTVAKVLFFSWPANGQRSVVDDRTFANGNKFTDNDLFRKFFGELSEQLSREGLSLSLVVHSFAHQLINGMLNAQSAATNIPTDKPTFDKIILLASDVTHLALKEPSGEIMVNHFGSQGDRLKYDYSGLTDIGSDIHIFYDHFDYLLYASSKKFNGGNLCLDLPDPQVSPSEDYRNLGNFGKEILNDSVSPKLQFHYLQDIIADGSPGNPLFYVFSNLADTKFNRVTERARVNNCYRGINDIRTFINSDLFANHHRYLFSCRPVVEKVLRILSEPASDSQIPIAFDHV
jgi:hypothetical protein